MDLQMKKRLTEAQFGAAIEGLEISQQTINIARGVLVDGLPQTLYVSMFKISKGAVSQAVNRVWQAHTTQVPAGYERVSVVLPEHQAYIVKKWAKDLK